MQEIKELINIFGSNFPYYVRYIYVIIFIILYVNLRRRLLKQPKIDRRLAVLDIDQGSIRLPVQNYETTIGRSRSCDVVIPASVISRQHAVLTMKDEGKWHIADTKSKGGTLVNGKKLKEDTVIKINDNISLAGIEMKLLPADAKISTDNKAPDFSSPVDKLQDFYSKFPHRRGSTILTILILFMFQFLVYIQTAMFIDDKYQFSLILSFSILMLSPWLYYGYATATKIHNISAELLGFLMSTMGIAVVASASPQDIMKQTIAMVLGVIIFSILLRILKDLELTMRLRLFTGLASIFLLLVLMVFGTNYNGQQNWINLGFITFQPSEFVKILFVFTGSATLEWLLTSKNLAILTIYTSGCIGLLFITGDFGTALIFFVAFLVLIFMTSGDLRAIILVCAAAVVGAIGLIRYKPHILDRFSLWGKVWTDVNNKGWQQTRTLMAIGSGGLLGLGSGSGFLKRISAADTDMVFGIICEEWGLIIGFFIIGFLILFLRAAIRSARSTRSSYYTISACTAAVFFLVQSALNIFGSTDILPFTGVTLPFISNGGTSMMASWGLLAFITASLNYMRPEVEADTVRAAQMRAKARQEKDTQRQQQRKRKKKIKKEVRT